MESAVKSVIKSATFENGQSTICAVLYGKLNPACEANETFPVGVPNWI